ncbi:hypothetical protein QFC20_002661 [Naganishia adeliensis]|uniref:Uncharacterized protein n=1 Tax=Naganishia adeliensis TaxID=92952 RepID=A0ACC2WKT8_9TREE|nr:hypothetical protein QFC20_002661 [Naganishia adeliensis]
MADHVVHTGVVTADLAQLMQRRDTRFYRGFLGKLTAIIFLALITSMTNGYDGSMMNGLQAVQYWQDYFGTPEGSLLGIFNAIQSIGGILALPFVAFTCDKFGRRMTIFFGSCIMLVGVAIQTAAQNIGMFIAARGIIGFGLGFACAAAPLLITELAFPTHRGPLTSLYNSSWYLGSIVAAWATFGTFRIQNDWSWRIPSLLQGLPSVLQVALILTIPESPRWLMDKGREEAARKVLVKYHCGGDESDPLAAYEFEEIRNALQIEKEANSSSSFKSLFVGKGNQRRMLVIIAIAFFSQWSGNGLVSYYLTKVLIGIGITNPETQTLINGILNIYNYGTAIFGALMCDRIGRRPLFLISTAGMTVCFCIWTACSAIYQKSAAEVDANDVPLHPNKSAGNAVLAMIFLFYTFYNLAMSPLLVAYTVEILPYKIRAKGLVMMNLAVNCALVFNQYVNPVAMRALEWKYYIVYCVFLAFEFVFCWFFIIETKNRSLEEISVLFDGEQVTEELKHRTERAELAEKEGALSPGFDEDKKLGYGGVQHLE